MDIEKVAAENPEKIITNKIDLKRWTNKRNRKNNFNFSI